MEYLLTRKQADKEEWNRMEHRIGKKVLKHFVAVNMLLLITVILITYACISACIHRHISYGNSRITMNFYYLLIHSANYDYPLTIITIATKYVS